MRRALLRTAPLAGVLAAGSLFAACGSSSSSSGSNPTSNGSGGNITEKLAQGTATQNQPGQGKRGGKVTMLASGDVDYMDPGQTYYSFAIGIMNGLHRTLYSYGPNDTTSPQADLASAPPQVAPDGKTVTVKIRPGVMFSPPVKRAVTSKDVKYAMERTFSSHLANGYQLLYYRDLVGAPKKLQADVPSISGIQTPDDQTLVFKLTKPSGAVLAGALALPATAPVPREYASKFDKQSPTTYGQHVVFTGPYQVANDPQGNLTGYKEGKLIRIIRNPTYQKVGDYRPAFLDEIDVQEGNEDTNVASRRILDGRSLISGDGGAPATLLRTALRSKKAQVSLKPSGGVRYAAMDTSRPPFDDINVRKAVVAGFDRTALRQPRGGPAIGPIAQGFIPPGIPGFTESGGLKGPAPDFMRSETGNKQLMAQYFKKAGFQSGRYEGNQTILLVGDSADPDKSAAQSVDRQLRQMGFKTRLRLVPRSTMFTKYCQKPAAEQNVCPSVGWLKDFADPQTMLQPTFTGEAINAAANNNWPELDDPGVNAAAAKAQFVNDPAQRARAWADVNRKIVDLAPAVPIVWDYENAISSANVRGVQNQFSTVWDLNFTSLR